LTRLRTKLAELVKVKAAVAAANGEIYDKIFRLAELKGLVTTLTGLDTKAGVFHEGRGFAESAFAGVAGVGAGIFNSRASK
jgi:hypothetical protein